MADKQTAPKPQHTPGPWTNEYDGSVCIGGQVAIPPVGPDGASRAERLANARLIAAAPELLEQAKFFERCIEWEISVAKREDPESVPGKTLSLGLLRAAIAKAEGK